MKERLLTIVLSSITTVIAMSAFQRAFHGPQTAVANPMQEPLRELVVERLIVQKELIVSDTGQPWEAGFERHEIPRGLVARSLGTGTAGVWVRGRLIKTEIDDPFDDRFHAINRDGSMFRAPGHMSWNVWLGDNWRQLAIIQGETLENFEMPLDQFDGGNHPGRLRIQTFRPHFSEPLTDAIIGQGMMSIGGGGYGGEGLPYPSEVLQLWGGKMQEMQLKTPAPPRVIRDDGSGERTYALIAVGPSGAASDPSPAVTAKGLATLTWDSIDGADTYILLRDGHPSGPLRIDGRVKEWTDRKPSEPLP